MSKFNTDVFVIPNSSDPIVHIPLRGIAFYTDSSSANIIDKINKSQPLKKEEIESEIFQVLTEIDVFGGIYKSPKINPLENFQPIEGVLIFTETCNLACGYCYASADTSKSVMELDLAINVVDEVFKNAALKGEMASFKYIGGGEPTIQWKLLVEVTNYINLKSNETGVKNWIRLVTNGTLLTEERVSWLTENIDYITLSFDILPEFQADRSYANGRPSHEKLMKTVKLLTSHGMGFHIRSTVSRESALKLVEMVQFIHRETGAKNIRLEPMAEIGRSVEQSLLKPVSQIFVENFIKARKFGNKNGLNVTCKMLQNVDRAASRFCEIEFSVNPNGVVTGCHRYTKQETDGYDLYEYGSYDGKTFNFDIDKLNSMRMIDSNYFEDCRSCYAKWNCASGCLSARTKNGEVSQHGPLCDLTRDILKYAITERLEEGEES